MVFPSSRVVFCPEPGGWKVGIEADDSGLGGVLELAPPPQRLRRVPPAEYKAMYHRDQSAANTAASTQLPESPTD
jgi:hypothetical protein